MVVFAARWYKIFFSIASSVSNKRNPNWTPVMLARTREAVLADS